VRTLQNRLKSRIWLLPKRLKSILGVARSVILMKLPRRRECRIIFIKAGLPEEERETLIAAPSFTIHKAEIATHLDSEERGLQHGWHGPSWKTRGMFRVLTFEPKWKCGAFLWGEFGVRVWQF
jgi:hypothetical protein